MDFFMPYPDYLKLSEIAEKELDFPYCFQNFNNTTDCGPMFSRIRNSQTTGCTAGEVNVVPPHNIGIFIDIFPLFYVPDNKVKRFFQFWHIKFYNVANTGYKTLVRKKYAGNFTWKDSIHPYVLIWRFLSLFMDHKEMCRRYLKACDAKKSNYVGISSFLPGKEKYIWKYEWFAECVKLPFENRMIPAPIEYEKVLTHQFGDWHRYVKDAAIHASGVIDTEVPYYITFKERFGDLHE